MRRREFLRHRVQRSLRRWRANRLPGESEAQYRARLARQHAAAAARTARAHAGCYYALRRYEFETPQQKARSDKSAAEALIPALNRNNIDSVGVFYAVKDPALIFMLIDHVCSVPVRAYGHNALRRHYQPQNRSIVNG